MQERKEKERGGLSKPVSYCKCPTLHAREKERERENRVLGKSLRLKIPRSFLSVSRRMFGIEADLLNLLGHIPSEDEDLERKVTEFERGKNKVLRSKLDEQKRVDSQLSRQKFEKEQKE